MSRMFQSLARPPIASTAPVAPHALQRPIALPVDDDDAFGPGWYESSSDLRRGLLVQEFALPQACADATAWAC